MVLEGNIERSVAAADAAMHFVPETDQAVVDAFPKAEATTAPALQAETYIPSEQELAWMREAQQARRAAMKGTDIVEIKANGRLVHSGESRRNSAPVPGTSRRRHGKDGNRRR